MWSVAEVVGGLPGDVLVGYFRPLREDFDGPAYQGQAYFMITNGLAALDAIVSETVQRITIDFDFGNSGISNLRRVSRDTGQQEVVGLESLGGSRYRLVLDLEGGTGDLLKFNTGALFVSIGDFEGNGVVDAEDINLLCDVLGTTVPPTDDHFDLTGDNQVNQDDADDEEIRRVYFL